MELEEECQFIRLLPDGSPIVKIRGEERKVEIHGIRVPQPPPEPYVDMFTRRLPRLRQPMRCIVESAEPGGDVRAKLLIYGWHDKSGDVWLDLSLVLLDQGLVKVVAGDFPERQEYLQHERQAQPSSRRESEPVESDGEES